MAKMGSSMSMAVLMVLSLAVGALCNNNGGQFSAFYFMQQWLASYCNQQGTPCCYPPSGKPAADFTVYGLWPYFSDNSFPTSCPGANFDVAPLKPIEGRLQKAWPSLTCPLIGRKFWLHEWNKRGTCSKSILDEMAYFNAAMDLKDKVNILQALDKAGIKPNNQFYPIESFEQAVFKATGFHPVIGCNQNAQGKKQIWRISVCVDGSGTKLVNCPFIPKEHSGCSPSVQFPSF